MMAFERLEPFGPLHQEFLFGQLCATLANVHRDPQKRSKAWEPRDFMPALSRALDLAHPGDDEPIFIEDPVAMSNLIRAKVFGLAEVKPHE